MSEIELLLIEKYREMPECRAKELIAELPPHWQEALNISIHPEPGNIRIAAFFKDWDKETMPADPNLRAIFEELTEILLAEVKEQPNHYLRDAWRYFPGYRYP